KLTLTNPYDTSAPIAERARSYLDVNCSTCHRFGGGGAALFDVRKELSPNKLNLIDAKPILGSFGIDDARLVCPSDPDRSVVIYRTSKLGRGRMPHIGSDAVDVRGTTLLREWIASLGTSSKSASIPSSPDDPTVAQMLSSTSSALALLGAIDSGTIAQDSIQRITAAAMKSPDEQVRDLFRRFDPASSEPRLGPTFNPATLLAMKGDAIR